MPNATPHRRSLIGFSLVAILSLAICNMMLGERQSQAQTMMAAKTKAATSQPATSQPATSQPAIPVKSAKDVPLREIQVISDKVDDLIQANYKKHRVRPNPPADDDTMLRRYYLAITGRIPTYEEVQVFDKRRDKNRRSDLVDHLLDSKGYTSDMFNFYADLLRVKSRNNRAIGEPWINWIKDSVKYSKPYNQMVYEMLTAEGYVWNNGAVGYYQRDMGMPLDNISNTTRVFLGTQVGCAQCHDHPFDIWTQMEFHEMSAYTYGIHTTNARWKYDNLKELYNKIRKQTKNKDKDDPERIMMNRAARNMLEPLQYPVFVRNKDLRLPDDYKYDDAKPKDVVQPRTIFGDLAEVPKGHSRPEVFAKWLTDTKNPRFTVVIVNRLWKDAFGVGLIEPTDDIKNDTEASNPELMDYLVQTMIDLKYDVKQFQRMIYNTQTYQRQASMEQLDNTKPYHFPGPVLRRMSAAQIWDSILTLAVQDIDERPGDVTGGRGYDYDKFNEYMDMNADALFTLVKESADVMVRRREFDNKRKEIERDMRQARNSKNTSEENKLKSDMQDLRKQYSDLLDMRKKQREQNKGKVDDDPRWRGVPRDMVRASEMEQPARPGHFLRMFGQSDREITNNGYDDSSIPQILSLMNGTLFQRIMRRDSILLEQVKKAGSGRDKLETVWVSILTRKPTASETSLVQSELRDVAKDEAFQDIVWALLNTREFMFVQ
ncbi:MAG: hypothetical protein CMJ19_07950 [Phycisphaeraceae bacterium]|nr:hypothetical protein [Phycisphaeraceae bacterium]